MSPVSTVFHAVVTVIGLKNIPRMRASILQHYMSMFYFNSWSFIFFWGTRVVETQMPDRESWSLSTSSTEDRHRRASGPVHIWFRYIYSLWNQNFIDNFCSFGFAVASELLTSSVLYYPIVEWSILITDCISSLFRSPFELQTSLTSNVLWSKNFKS